MPQKRHLLTALLALIGLTTGGASVAQSDQALERLKINASNKPLSSFAEAGNKAKAERVLVAGPKTVPNFIGQGKAKPGTATATQAAPDAALQAFQPSAATTLGGGFPGASNNDNGQVLGFIIAPPDTDGSVGPNHFVQMINSITTVFDKAGNIVQGPFPSNAIWAGIGGNCEPFNQGDPIVLYDDQADRWLLSQFAFPDNLSSFSQCVAVSQTGDPTGAYNRYEFSFDGFGFNDYPKHGIVDDSVTMIANLFRQRGPRFSFAGTFLGVMDKNAMYSGQPASLLGSNIGSGEFGFVAGDLDGAGSSPALFATAMSTANAFDIWQIDVDWNTENFSTNQIASIPVTPFDATLCGASRGACIPQPNGGPALEGITDRLMHRLQIRDFGNYKTMVTTHTVDVGNGRAGLRWYELRDAGNGWSLYQEGTFGPNDGENRWMGSVAMNGNGDIGIGYLLGSANTFVSTAVAGQSAAQSGSGQLDSAESICGIGTGVQLDTARAGDYSSTSIDPVDGSFWHTNEVILTTGQFSWATWVCNFSVSGGGPIGNIPPVASFTDNCTDLSCSFDASASSDPDGTIASYVWDFGDGSSATGVTANNTYGAAGTYTVQLTVTDNEGATGTSSRSVTVTSGGGADISLSASGTKVRGRQRVNLSYSGATSSNVDIVRDGTVIDTVTNSGAYLDNIGARGGATYVYQVCEAGTSTCSNTATVVF